MKSAGSSSETSNTCETFTQDAVQVSIKSPPVTACCVLQPQSEPSARFVPVASQVDIVPVQSSSSPFRSITVGTAFTFYPKFRGSKRPLYLEFSCLLI
jgi:hypothetical protein